MAKSYTLSKAGTQNQEFFREALQIADVPAILPHDSAFVSNTRS